MDKGSGRAVEGQWKQEGCWKGSGRVLEGCWKGSGSRKGVGRVLEGCWKGVGRVLEGCWKGVGRVAFSLVKVKELTLKVYLQKLKRRLTYYPSCAPSIKASHKLLF